MGVSQMDRGASVAWCRARATAAISPKNWKRIMFGDFNSTSTGQFHFQDFNFHSDFVSGFHLHFRPCFTSLAANRQAPPHSKPSGVWFRGGSV